LGFIFSPGLAGGRYPSKLSGHLPPPRPSTILVSLLIVLFFSICSCRTEIRECFHNDDCPSDKVCDTETWTCRHECEKDSECPSLFKCLEHRCSPRGGQDIACGDGMVPVEGAYCIDRFEASRPDATGNSPGTDASKATSRKGVLPWQVQSNAEADQACRNAGKRLCKPEEWGSACKGPEQTAYTYGDTYEPKTCNSIHALGEGNQRLMPTGSFPECTNAYGAFDMSGNVWEQILGGDDKSVRGGAWNCSTPQDCHQCDYIPGFVPNVIGFRCCKDPSTPDAGADGDTDIDGDADTDGDSDAAVDAGTDASGDVGG